MVPIDLPPRPALIAQKTPSTREQLLKILDSGDSKPPSTHERIEGKKFTLGQIDCIMIPPGWIEGTPIHSNIGSMGFHEFHPPAHPKTQLCFYYRGMRTNAETATSFRLILDKPVHRLSHDELSSIGHVLGDMAAANQGQDDPDFLLGNASTVKLNGRAVLIVDGFYPKIQESIHAIFIDADSDGQLIQEVYYQGPKAMFAHCKQQALRAIDSIEWK